jgi:hypothetical protein
MQTWMDAQLYGIINELSPDEIATYGVKTDIDAAAYIFNNAKSASYDILEDQRSLMLWGPFALACKGDILSTDVKAIRLTSELVQDLVNAKPPHNYDYNAALGERLWYIDVPDRALVVRTGVCLRAIFLRRYRERGAEGIIYDVCMCSCGSNSKVEHHTGFLDGDLLDCDAYFDESQAVNAFIKLAIVYSSIAENAQRTSVPRISQNDVIATVNESKRKAKQKKFTMFVVQELAPPPDHFGRGGTKSSWKLDHRVRVSGHFRLQAHGENYSLRKLIWVAEYEKGPKDGLTKPHIAMMRKGVGNEKSADTD